MKRFDSIKFLEDLIKFIDKDRNYGSCSLIVKDTKSNEYLHQESVIFIVTFDHKKIVFVYSFKNFGDYTFPYELYCYRASKSLNIDFEKLNKFTDDFIQNEKNESYNKLKNKLYKNRLEFVCTSPSSGSSNKECYVGKDDDALFYIVNNLINAGNKIMFDRNEDEVLFNCWKILNNIWLWVEEKRKSMFLIMVSICFNVDMNI